MASAASPLRDHPVSGRPRRDTDDELDEAWMKDQRRRIEEDMLIAVKDAREMRDRNLAKEEDENERARINTNYEDEMKSLRAIANEQFRQAVIEEKARRLNLRRAEAERAAALSVEEQKRIMEQLQAGNIGQYVSTPSCSLYRVHYCAQANSASYKG